ncbi:periplasmic/membrane protein [Vibrio ishigakensis]|uniref:Periplasmic protein n=1 Tax=Vibrio ishigakensis TaxID=1481914 RepID=A0A0B8PMG1_9VIBR|nr:DUF2489 domain-containing protein [Vibrio ishigakensis]GAM54648.1 periplasmic protein [Vibrio ishigakensis]GAM63879.1 periplasmic/membrane protein [Vibrio ishigakensis]GAM70303.1 periplasmic/membrane protein [Vibrio sp. JCM 19236]
MNTLVLAAIGGIIILGLGGYAAHLLLKLRKQNQLVEQHKALAIEKRNAKIFESVDTLCLAGIQGQCDLSEISIRLCNILDYVQGEQRIDVAKTYPALHELFEVVKDMARGEDRQELAKQERMRQNLARHKAESRLTDTIITELEDLRSRVAPLNNQISIQMQ